MTKFKIIGGKAIISEGTTEIKNWAFPDGKLLTSVTIPDSVTKIHPHAFDGCGALSEIVVSDGNTVYDSRDNCNAIIETKNNKLVLGCSKTMIPDSVNEIGDSAFEVCKGLTGITIPDSVVKIGKAAFEGCSGLTSITIPASVKVINGNPFEDCVNLSNIVVDEGNTVYDSRDDCNAIIETLSNKLIAGCYRTVIPDSVSEIDADAFCGCAKLTSIIIPNSVTAIKDSAFWYCQSLSGITIPDSVKRIGWFAFEGCANLSSITLSSSVTDIGCFAFGSCVSLTRITIPDSVAVVGYNAFSSCSGLTSITIPKSMIENIDCVFNNCINLSKIVVSDGSSEYEYNYKRNTALQEQ